jgi:hypothetical protein
VHSPKESRKLSQSGNRITGTWKNALSMPKETARMTFPQRYAWRNPGIHGLNEPPNYVEGDCSRTNSDELTK